LQIFWQFCRYIDNRQATVHEEINYFLHQERFVA